MSLEQRGSFMKRDRLFLPICTLLLVILPIILPGCGGRIFDWGKDNFYQGETIDWDFELVRSYIKSQRVYDQFTIVGQFDALWLSDEVRTAYADFYCCVRSKTEEQKRIFLRRQLEENNHFVTFYVLSLKHVVLGDSDSKWSVSLCIDDRHYIPAKIKTIELSPEYKKIFGKKYNSFKDAYLIYFNAKDVEDNYIIRADIQRSTLAFRSIEKETALCWELCP